MHPASLTGASSPTTSPPTHPCRWPLLVLFLGRPFLDSDLCETRLYRSSICMEVSIPQFLTVFLMGQAGAHKVGLNSLFVIFQYVHYQAVYRPSKAGMASTITTKSSTSTTWPAPGAATVQSPSRLPWMAWMTLVARLTSVGEGGWSAVGGSITTCTHSPGGTQPAWRPARSSGDSWKKRQRRNSSNRMKQKDNILFFCQCHVTESSELILPSLTRA